MAKVKITTMLKEANVDWLRDNAEGNRQIGGLIDDCIEAVRHGRPIAKRLEDAVDRFESLLTLLEAMIDGVQEEGDKAEGKHDRVRALEKELHRTHYLLIKERERLRSETDEQPRSIRDN